MHRQLFICLLLLSWLLSVNVHAADDLPAVVYLDEITTSDAWREGNLSIHQPSELRIAGRPAMRLDVALEQLDNKSWPKAWSPVVMSRDADWTRFDRLEFWAMARLRPPLVTPPKKLAVQFLCPDKEQAVSSTVFFPESDTWVHVSIPTRDLQTLQNLKAMQVYLAKRWYKGVDEVVFHLGGFRLVRDAGPVANECHLLTPFPSSDQPTLRLQASDAASMPLQIQQDGRVLHEVRTTLLPSGQHAVDLSSLNLAQGRYELVAHHAQRQAREVMTFHWQPLKLEHASLGEGYTGSNVAAVSLRNASASPGEVRISVRLDGSVVAEKQASVPADSSAKLTLAWPLNQGQKGKASLQVYAGDSYVGGSSQLVHAPDVYANLSQLRAVTFQISQPISFRLPLSLASGSREQARLRWVLSDLQGNVIDTGQSHVQSSFAPVEIEPEGNVRAGRYALEATLELNGQAYKKEWTLYFVEDPTADLPLSPNE